MIELFHRDGTLEKSVESTPAKGFIQVRQSCHRCGGSGRYSSYHGTCFRCGGNGVDPTPGKLYTRAKLDQLNAAQAKRRQTKEDAHLAKCKAALAEVQAEVEGFDVARIQAQLIVSSGLSEANSKHNSLRRHFATISDMIDKQLWTAPAAKHLIRVLGWYNDSLAKIEAERRAADEAVKNPGNWVRAGKQSIEGKVLTTKWKEQRVGNGYYSHYVETLKMLVQDDHGRKFWGTCPKCWGESIKGCTVRFNATVETSADDKMFGFYKRPSKPVQLTDNEGQPVQESE